MRSLKMDGSLKMEGGVLNYSDHRHIQNGGNIRHNACKVMFTCCNRLIT